MRLITVNTITNHRACRKQKEAREKRRLGWKLSSSMVWTQVSLVKEDSVSTLGQKKKKKITSSQAQGTKGSLLLCFAKRVAGSVHTAINRARGWFSPQTTETNGLPLPLKLIMRFCRSTRSRVQHSLTQNYSVCNSITHHPKVALI